MEEELKRLIQAGDASHRIEWGLSYKRQGKKVVGIACSYIPEEVIYAAGILPWRIAGTFQANTPLAAVYLPVPVCSYFTHVIESLLKGELEFLDGLVCTNWDDDRRRLFDLWVYLAKTPFTHLMEIPAMDSELACQRFAKEIRQLITAVGEFVGAKITDELLWSAIEVHETMRGLLMRLYELRKREVPPLSGAEIHGITAAAAVMPKELFIQELEALLPYLEQRKISVKSVRPRLLASTDMMHEVGYLRLIEETGALVAMDDLDTGSRYIWHKVDRAIHDPAYALAKRYLGRPACPRMITWDRQVQQLVEWVMEYRIQGVVELPLSYSRPRQMRIPYFRKALADANIPLLSVIREYELSYEEQWKTKVGAFIEMLEEI